MVKNEISSGVQQTKCSIEDVVICKLNKAFFNLQADLFLINAYIKPCQTSTLTSGTKGLDTLKDLDQLVNRLLGTGDVLLCGDYNALTASFQYPSTTLPKISYQETLRTQHLTHINDPF